MNIFFALGFNISQNLLIGVMVFLNLVPKPLETVLMILNEH